MKTAERTERAKERDARGFFREFYIYDLANEGRLIFASATPCRKARAEGLFEKLSEEDRREWISFLTSYQMKPAVADSCLGKVVVLPYLMPSASLAMVFVLHGKGSDLCKLMIRDPNELIRLGEAVRNAEKGRLHDADGARKRRYDAFMEQIPRCFGERNHEELDEWIISRAEAIAELLGLSVVWQRKKVKMSFADLDEGLFLAYVTMILGLERESRGEGTLTFAEEQRSFGRLFTVRISELKRDPIMLEPLLCMDRNASQRRIVFEMTKLEDGMMIRFAPTSMDWAYLGLKQKQVFPSDWQLFTDT